MGAPAKFLFDVDFAAGGEREATVTLAEHATKLAEAEAAAQRRGYAQAQKRRRGRDQPPDRRHA
jgi:hypothetical protein